MIWSPHTIGDDHPCPGTSVFHATLIVVDHRVGTVSIAVTARPDGPRNCGHVASTGRGSRGMNVVIRNISAAVRVTRTAAVYTVGGIGIARRLAQSGGRASSLATALLSGVLNPRYASASRCGRCGF